MHEHTSRHHPPIAGSTDRVFGFVFGSAFMAIAFYPMLNGQAVRVWSCAIAGIFLLLAIAVPSLLAPANRLWTRFGVLLHKIVSPIAFGVLYYFVVTPTGLLMRLLGKNPLHMRFDPAAESYWIKRTPPGPTPDSLNNQF